MFARVAPAIVLAVTTSTAGCSVQQLGFPSTPVSAPSPDGRYVAFVRNHPDIDPPSQSIWVGERSGAATQVARLGPDSDWCNTIVWSPDSTTVGFLIQDARLVTVDARSQQIVSNQWLTPWKGEYPPYQMAVELTLDARGSDARFRVCDREMLRPGYVLASTNCGDFRRIALTEASGSR